MNIAIVHAGLPPVYTRKTDFGPEDEVLETALSAKPYQRITAFMQTAEDLRNVELTVRREAPFCLIVSLSSWTRISLVVELIRSCKLPTALYARTSDGRNGTTALTAVSASLIESSGSAGGFRHRRFMEGMEADLGEWIDGVRVVRQLRASRLLCWGGHSGADIPYTRSDPSAIERMLFAEILYEQESVLVDKAEQIIAREPERAVDFLNRISALGLKISRDDIMVTEISLTRQAALYLAARDRLGELAAEQIIGVSIKCHFELSTTGWGCTACFLPAFLPFPDELSRSTAPCGEGTAGSAPIIPVACEGDLNGLASSVMLHAVNPEVPPLFGDFVIYQPRWVLLRNCGASSVFWAGLSNSPARSFPKAHLSANMHGKSGAALHYETPTADLITACRLFRFGESWRMMLGTGRIIGEAESGSSFPDPWPHSRIDFGVDTTLLFETYPCNHGSVTLGDVTNQIETICSVSGISVIRLDSEAHLRSFRDELR